MTRRNVIMISILLLAVAAGVIVSGLKKERQWTPPANPRYLDPIYLEVPKDFAPIKPALGKEIEGKRSTYVFDPSTPKIRFAVSRGGREYWLESELQESGIRNQEAEVVQKGNSIIWNEIFAGVTAQYDTYDGYVKETFTLADANSPRSFTFKLTPGTDVILDDREGGYVMVKSALNGEELFMLRPPQGLDSRNFRVDYKYRLDKSDTSDRSYILTLYPASPEQFSDAQYPVSIDPSHQVVEWDEALVQVGQNCAEAGCGQDGDIIDFKPAGWNWGTAERREFVIVKVPKMSREQREEYTRRQDGAVQYAIDYTQLAAPEELSVIRDPAQLSSVLDATRQPNVIKHKPDPKASVIPPERRLAYSPPPKPQGLRKILLALVRPVRAATTVTSSIGTASRDYSTLQAWETAKNGNLVTADQVQKGEAYNDSTFTAGLTIDGSTTDATRYMWLTVASGQRHNGTAGTGAKVDPTTAGHVILVQDDYTIVEWLEIADYGAGSKYYYGIRLNSESNSTVRNNLVHDDVYGGDSVGIGHYSTGGGDNIYNNFIYSGTQAYNWYTGIVAYWSSAINVYNNTVYMPATDNGGNGIVADNTSNVVVKNNLMITVSTSFTTNVGSWSSDSNYNASSDTTSPGANSLDNVTAANELTSTTLGSENLHLKAGASSINAGTDLSATFTIDIDNETRPTGANTWDMGADELLVTPSITSVTDTPDPTNPNRSVTFSIDWSDPNSGETVKVKVCKTDALSAQNCTGGSWATSTAFTTSDPESLVYDIVGGDAGQTRSYYAFVCDDDANCSSSTSGTFSVNAQSTVPDVKVRGGTKFRGGTVR